MIRELNFREILFLILIFLSPFLILACAEERGKKEIDVKVEEYTFRGHRYLYFPLNVSGEIVHDPDCPCNEN